MRARHDRDDLIFVPGVHGGVRRQIRAHRPLDQRDVDRTQRADDVGRVAVHGMQRHFRIAPMKVREQVWQQVTGRRGGRADPQRALLEAAQRVAVRMRLAPSVTQPRRILRELLTGCRQTHAATVALIKRLAELVLKLAQLTGYRRLRQVQRHRRPADIQVLGHGGKGYKLIRGHAAEISDLWILSILNHDFSYSYI